MDDDRSVAFEVLLAGAPALALAAITVGEGRVRRGESGVERVGAEEDD
jgi:hypothetical protein